jgi:hypothetical protein
MVLKKPKRGGFSFLVKLHRPRLKALIAMHYILCYVLCFFRGGLCDTFGSIAHNGIVVWALIARLKKRNYD